MSENVGGHYVNNLNGGPVGSSTAARSAERIWSKL
jgi:hypothetical protein